MTQRLIGACLVGLSIAYLALFVPRGWIPHDEGMIGESAERVLHGQVPHVDYEEPYTGGLAHAHALLFGVTGAIDLIYPRWLLFAGAVLAQVIVYLVLRRFLPPIGAAIAAWLALAWSFPNYFAALPSWWLLVCALVCLWAFIRYAESGLVRYAALAGLTAGISILIKQTGLYLLIALIAALVYGGRDDKATHTWWPGRIACAGVAVVAMALAIAILSTRLSLSDLVYLLLPILACSRVLLTDDMRPSTGRSRNALIAPAIAVASAALPAVAFVMPYMLHQHVWTLVHGLFVLPRKRVQFAAFEMPPVYWILAGLPLLAALMPLPAALSRTRDRYRRALSGSVWVGGALLLGGSLYTVVTYQIVWQAARGIAALLPVGICGLLMSAYVTDPIRRKILFGAAVFLAWASLVQVPFSAPIYFCYVTPLAVVAAAAVASHSSALRRPVVHVAAAVLLGFALLSMNRGYVYNLGGIHRVLALDEPTGVDRATLRVSRADAVTYRRLIELVTLHSGTGHVVAGPDAPEVYFLMGRFSPSNTFFDFFSDSVSAEGGLNDMTGLPTASVVVLNHGRRFSQGPSVHLATKARRMFPHSEAVGAFEVRWK